MYVLGLGENAETENVHLLEQRGVQRNILLGANCFLFVAVISILSSVRILSSGHFGFLLGLGITSMVGESLRIDGHGGMATTLAVYGCTAGLFLAFWHFGAKGAKWAFLIGMLFYLVDTLILLLFRRVVAAGFHAFMLFEMYQGFAAIAWLRRLQQSQIAASGAPIQPR
jgi:hypothetical protein